MDGSKKVVRNIPIWIEGRDEPIINKDFDEMPSQSNFSNVHHHADQFANSARRSFTPPRFATHSHDMPDHGARQSYSPQPTPVNSHHTQAAAASSSSENVAKKTQSTDSVKEIKVPVQVEQSAPSASAAPSQPQQQHPAPPISQEQKQLESSIEKIQTIQSSVLDLMKKIEEYNGDKKDYLFLDEMLTQNLIKLDNIDTNIDVDGKENVKNARREAIKCINSLISLLEEKKESFEAQKNTKE